MSHGDQGIGVYEAHDSWGRIVYIGTSSFTKTVPSIKSELRAGDLPTTPHDGTGEDEDELTTWWMVRRIPNHAAPIHL